jgi:hypothetical protein
VGVGDGVRVPLRGVLLLSARGAASEEPRCGDMAGRHFAQLPGGLVMDAVRDEHLLVHYDAHHGGVRRPAPRQQGGDGLRHLLHVDEPGAHRVHYRQHDQSHHPAHGAHASLCKEVYLNRHIMRILMT